MSPTMSMADPEHFTGHEQLEMVAYWQDQGAKIERDKAQGTITIHTSDSTSIVFWDGLTWLGLFPDGVPRETPDS